MNLSQVERILATATVCACLTRTASLANKNLTGRPGRFFATRRSPAFTGRSCSKEAGRQNRQSSMSATADGEATAKPDQGGWTVCPKCHGEGKIYKAPSRKARMQYKRAKLNYEEALRSVPSDEENSSPAPPKPPQARDDPCPACNRTGLVRSDSQSTPNAKPNPPKIAIIGGGLGGLALAVACRHRSIPCTVYERDAYFAQRSQGYGLTMQQASRSLSAFGILLEDGQTSTKHVVHQPDGEVVGEWGLRKWGRDSNKPPPKRQNVHIARQSLRWQLLQALGGESEVRWSHKLIEYGARESLTESSSSPDNRRAKLKFQVEGEKTTEETADLIVGADGIRSCVRSHFIGDDASPLRYLDCLVVLGICPLEGLKVETRSTPLLDGETVFQTADGSTRIYAMPFSDIEYMWQLSFPMDEFEAINISRSGADALKAQAIQKCKTWHEPILELLERTPTDCISGYPVYDRDLITAEMLKTDGNGPLVTLLGDAAHPMSPFKGQGANQSLLDALTLAQSIYKNCCRNGHPVEEALEYYHQEMTNRSATKVKASAQAAQFLHTSVAIQKGNVTRGAAAASTASPVDKV